VVHTDALPWLPSPRPGVWRKRLELRGPEEAGRVTSLVRYDPGSAFALHAHPDGEEILVLDGVFADQYGRYPAGTFLLNPEGFEHAPFSNEGCSLLVKLRQSPGRRRPVRIQTRSSPWQVVEPARLWRLTLYSDAAYPERIHLTRVAPGLSIGPVFFPGGEEIFVLDGAFSDEHGSYQVGSWLRFPAGDYHTLTTKLGCTLYVKQGHLREPSAS
jgi:anti-sigma factor ChrR (cupin superfamily)